MSSNNKPSDADTGPLGPNFAVNMPLVVLSGILGVLSLIVVVFGAQAWFLKEEQGEMLTKSAGSINVGLAEMRQSQQKHLTEYSRWLDDKKQEHIVVPVSVAVPVLLGNGGNIPGLSTTQPAVIGGSRPPGGGLDAAKVDAGKTKFQALGCVACHSIDGSKLVNGLPAPGPTQMDVFGSQVELEGGQTVLADELYIRESIREPQAKIVKGYAAVQMPNFGAAISDEDLDNLTEFLRSISKITNPTGGGSPAAPAGSAPGGTTAESQPTTSATSPATTAPGTGPSAATAPAAPTTAPATAATTAPEATTIPAAPTTAVAPATTTPASEPAVKTPETSPAAKPLPDFNK